MWDVGVGAILIVRVKREKTDKEIMQLKRKRITRGMSRINEILEMPAEVVSNIPKISILGFEEMLIENYKNIIEYEDFYIKVNTHIGVINVNGFNLNLIQMNQDDMKITGKIDSIDFENYEEDEMEEK